MTRRVRFALTAGVVAALTWSTISIAGAAASPTYEGAADYYQPPAHTNWMWEIGTPLVTSNARLMGTGVTAWNGDTPPGDNPKLYDIDAILNPAATVATLHARGDHVICYVEVGSAGDYYTAHDEGVPTTYFDQLKAAGDLGRKLPSYPEYFININTRSALSIVKHMIAKQCAGKGFDAVETDLDETFDGNEGPTGFTITQADEESYLSTLAKYMHSIGLGWIAKNLDDTGRASFVNRMEPLAQGIVTEQCNQYHTCALLDPFRTDGKWIGNAEYAPETRAQFCRADNAANINGILFDVNLAGGRKPCR